MSSELEMAVQALGIKAEVKYGTTRPIPNGMEGMHPYTVRLRFQRRSLTTSFFMGSALTREPTAADVLSSLLLDATSVENAGSFEEWARDLGYDPDSRKAEKIYRACERTVPKLRRFLGDHFDQLARAEH